MHQTFLVAEEHIRYILKHENISLKIVYSPEMYTLQFLDDLSVPNFSVEYRISPRELSFKKLLDCLDDAIETITAYRE